MTFWFNSHPIKNFFSSLSTLWTGFLGRWEILFFFFLFVVNFVIHWNETALGLHVFPIPIPPPTSLSIGGRFCF